MMTVFELRQDPDGPGYVLRKEELDTIKEEIQDSYPGDTWTIVVREMTQEQYDAAPEFEGW